MRPVVLAILLAAASAAPAAAEDFTGFYAGVNAGLISERGDRSPTTVTIPPGAFSADAAGLPPSALGAADRMTGRDARSNARSAPRR